MGLTMTTNYLVWSIPGFLLLVLYGKWTGEWLSSFAEQSFAAIKLANQPNQVLSPILFLKACAGSMGSSPPRRNQPGQHCRRQQGQARPGQHSRVDALDLVELRSDVAHTHQCHRNPNRQTQQNLQHRSPHHHRHHAAALGTQRHADTNLRSPPHDAIGGHAV